MNTTLSTKTFFTLVVIVTLGISFQIGHFLEHAYQFGVWVFGPRDKPWMSVVAMWLCEKLGMLVLPMPDICTDEKAFMARQMALGMEVLHLVGNSIFLVTIGLLYYLIPSKWIKAALYVETFHLYEHIMLTCTLIFLGKPVGLSTLFGGTAYFFGKEGIVGYRVGWHFVMNFIPTFFLMKDWKNIKNLIVTTFKK